MADILIRNMEKPAIEPFTVAFFLNGKVRHYPSGQVIGEYDELPAADVRPVVRGRWKRVDPRSTVVTFKCSVCDWYAHMNATNFCPNCGADMREAEAPHEP